MSEDAPACLQPEIIQALAHGELSGEEKLAAQRLLKQSEPCRDLFRKLTAHRFPSIANYTIFEEVGKGGFGVVYKAMHHDRGRVEALKLLFSQAPLLASYFHNEVHLIAGLRHPNIATLYDAQLSTPPLFYTMEFVEGERLNDYLRRKPVSLAERLEIVRSVALALHYAHSQGVVHRDIKPQNILIDSTGQPRIVDFGIAAAMRAPESTAGTDAKAPEGAVGTLGYVAPEQVAGAAPDPRADVFALGALLFSCVTGEPARLARDPAFREPLIRERGVPQPEDLSAIVARCVETDPNSRYADSAGLADDLSEYLAGRSISARHEPSIARRAARVASLVLRSYPLTVRCAVVVMATTLITAAFWLTQARVLVAPTAQQRTTMITFTPRTMEQIETGAIGRGIDGLAVTNRQSLRLLHGELMRRLAAARPLVVVWDYFFPLARPEFDPGFANGAAKLRERGIPVLVGVAMFDVNGEPLLSPEIRDAVSAYGSLASGNADYMAGHFEVLCAFKRGFEQPIPGLAVAAYAATRFPRDAAIYEIDEAALRLHIRYRRPSAEIGRSRWEPTVDELPLQRVDVVKGGEVRSLRTMNEGDRVALTRVVADDPQVWAPRSVAYEDVLAADDAQIARWFDGRAVVVAQALPGEDQHRLNDGRTIFGCQLHAEALDSFLSARYQVRLHPAWLALSALVWAAAAALLVTLSSARLTLSLRATCIAAVVCVVVGLLLALQTGATATMLWQHHLAVAGAAMLVAAPVALLAKAYRQHLIQFSPGEVVPTDAGSGVQTTLLAGRRP